MWCKPDGLLLNVTQDTLLCCEAENTRPVRRTKAVLPVVHPQPDLPAPLPDPGHARPAPTRLLNRGTHDPPPEPGHAGPAPTFLLTRGTHDLT